MRSLLSRFSDWVVVHPVLWGVGSGVVLVLLGFALNLAPIVVIAAGAAIGVLNILHARRRGYCPLPAEPGSHLVDSQPCQTCHAAAGDPCVTLTELRRPKPINAGGIHAARLQHAAEPEDGATA